MARLLAWNRQQHAHVIARPAPNNLASDGAAQEAGGLAPVDQCSQSIAKTRLRRPKVAGLGMLARQVLLRFLAP